MFLFFFSFVVCFDQKQLHFNVKPMLLIPSWPPIVFLWVSACLITMVITTFPFSGR